MQACAEQFMRDPAVLQLRQRAQAACSVKNKPENGDFLLVLAVKHKQQKEKKRAPQALAGGRKGTGKG